MPVIAHATVEALTLPLVAPFAVAARTAHAAHNVLMRITSSEGEVGLGLAAPVEYVTGETSDTVVGTLLSVAPALADLPLDRLAPLIAMAHELVPRMPAARTALEMALLDLWAKRWGIPLWQYYGAASAGIASDLTIPIVDAQSAAQSVRVAWEMGFRSLKIKVGSNEGLDADYARLEAITHAAPDAVLRIDANQAFSVSDAIAFITRATAINPHIELIEQPLHKDDFDGFAAVRRKCKKIALFADESAQTPESVLRLIKADAVDGINVKIMKSGLVGAWEIANLCHAHGIKLMIGCMLESTISLSAACALAAGVGWFDFIDLDSHRLLAPTPQFTGGFSHDGPILKPNCDAPGWGVRYNPG